MPEDNRRPPCAGLVFLVHREGDHVAVAVRDAPVGEATGAYLGTGARFQVTVRAPVPLGHKIALCDLAEGETVKEYGAGIGVTRCPIAAGELVHTHNLRSARWQKSV